MAATAFASSVALDHERAGAAPVHYPRPSRAGATVASGGRQGRAGCGALGLTRSATCSSTCRATGARRARSPSWCAARRATVVVEVLSDRVAAGAPPRDAPARRGDRGRRQRLDEGRRSSTSRGWSQRYPAGTRLVLHGKYEARNRFGVQVARGDSRGGATGGRRGGALPGHRGTVLDADPGARPPARERAGRRRGAAAGPAAGSRAAARPAARAGRCRTSPAIRTTRTTRDAGWRSRSCCSLQLALLRRRRLRRRAQTRRRARRRAGAERALAGDDAAVRADGRPAPGDRGDRRRSGGGDADAAAADGRGRLRQDGGRAVRAAARGRARLPGGADGAHRDAGRAALRNDPER